MYIKFINMQLNVHFDLTCRTSRRSIMLYLLKELLSSPADYMQFVGRTMRTLYMILDQSNCRTTLLQTGSLYLTKQILYSFYRPIEKQLLVKTWALVQSLALCIKQIIQCCLYLYIYIFQESQPMPVMQLFPPANPHALANDHSYLKLTPQDQYLKDEMVSYFHAFQFNIHTYIHLYLHNVLH